MCNEPLLSFLINALVQFHAKILYSLKPCLLIRICVFSNCSVQFTFSMTMLVKQEYHGDYPLHITDGLSKVITIDERLMYTLFYNYSNIYQLIFLLKTQGK